MDEAALLGESIERLLADCGPREGVGRSGIDTERWRALVEGGYTRVGVSETCGGAGGTVAQAHVVLDRLGWAGASVPVAEAMIAGWLCTAAGIELPDGVVTVAPSSPRDALTVENDGTRWHVRGTAARVPWAAVSAHIVAASPCDGGLLVGVVPASGAFVVDGRNVAGEGRDRVELHAIELAAAQVGVAEGLAPDQVLRWGAMTRAVQLAGALRRATELSRDHVMVRIQFGRTLASFQHIRLRLAEMAEEVAAVTVAAATAMVASGGQPSVLAVGAAKVRAARAAGMVAGVAHQLHGAIGFTDEHPLHRLTTRAWAWRDEFGTEGWWAERLGAEAIAAGAELLWPSIVGA